MAAFFESATHIDDVVLFLDEVEEFAAQRNVGSPAGASACTNEFLKGLGRFRSGQARLLVAATNHVDRLDAAILRPGRFDLVLPIGPPDSATRRAIVEDRLHRTTNAVTSIEDLVCGTVGSTTADIIHLLDRATHLAFEAALAGSRTALTDAHLEIALAAASPTLTTEDLEKFDKDDRRYARR